MKKLYIIVPGVIAAFLGAAIIGGHGVLAQTGTDHQSFVSELAQKLGLEESKVQGVVNEMRDERKADWQSNFETRLSQLVTDGKITDEQKQMILDKQKEVQSQLADLKGQDLAMSERHTKMKEIFDNLQTWAKDNNLDPKYVGLFGHGMGFKKGFRMGYMMDKNQ